MNASRSEPTEHGIRYGTAIAAAALAAIAAIAAATGGARSPVIALLNVPLVVASLISPRRAVIVATLAAAAYGAVAAISTPRPAASEAAVRATLLYVIAAAVSMFSQSRNRMQRRLTAAAAEAQDALDVQHLINTAYDLSVTLDLVILKQRELLPARSLAVLLAENETLTIRASSGLAAPAQSFRFRISDDDNGWCPADGKPLVLPDVGVSRSAFAALDQQARSVLLVPLQSVERVVGLLFFGGAEPSSFGPQHVARAEAFANRMVFPIQRALLEEELRRLAYTDAQTALYNHRHFQGQLDEEVHRALRYGRPVSLIMLDIDDFKRFNDTYGHPAGDRILQMLARTLVNELRAVDIPARYGGEEFAIICPETHAEQAVVLAERLRSSIARSPYDVGNGQPHDITVSIGVAALPDHADSKSDLVDAADRALYEAKRSGKNRVVAAPCARTAEPPAR